MRRSEIQSSYSNWRNKTAVSFRNNQRTTSAVGAIYCFVHSKRLFFIQQRITNFAKQSSRVICPQLPTKSTECLACGRKRIKDRRTLTNPNRPTINPSAEEIVISQYLTVIMSLGRFQITNCSDPKTTREIILIEACQSRCWSGL